jgi:excisionase family DNA binding protein
MLTVIEVGQRLGLKPATIRMWIAKRKMAHVKLGRSVRIPETEIDRVIRENTVPARDCRRYAVQGGGNEHS